MTRHPGGEEHTRQMLELSALETGARILDMGAGDGGAVRLMERMPGIRGVHFQPLSRFGRCGLGADAGDITIPFMLISSGMKKPCSDSSFIRQSEKRVSLCLQGYKRS